MPADYGYINARIRAMKSFLLKRADYLEALQQKNLDEFVSFLSHRASYAHDSRQVLGQTAAGINGDEILKLNFCRIFRKILNFSEGEPKRLIQILLTSYDIYNLKTIIRGILTAQKKEVVIQATIPAGIWDLADLNQLVADNDLKTLADTLLMLDKQPLELEKEFSKIISDYTKDTPLEILENSLLKVYFQKAKEYLKKEDTNAALILDYLSFECDCLNILFALRKITQPDIEVEFMSGGSLPEVFLENLVLAKSPEEALRRFSGTKFRWLSQAGLELYKNTQRLSSLERLLKKERLSFCSKLYKSGDPLSIGIPLAFINFKENEISNLRLIGKAISFRMPEDLIEGEIIYAE